MRTNVYVDAFNFYYGKLKGTPHKWLDLAALCRLLLPQHTINEIKYFTALVRPLTHDPDQPARQQAYLRALDTIPNLTIIYGQFLRCEKYMPLVANPSNYVKVIKMEEKGSDVNLATHLLCDAFRNEYDVAVVISNDSDLLLPIKVVRSEFGKTVGILNPQKRPSRDLKGNVDFFKQIRSGVLGASQFSPTISTPTGSIQKPSTW